MINEHPLIPPYPLAWPEGLERNQRKASSTFKTGLSGALANVRKSLQLFGSESGKQVTGISITSNATLLEQSPSDPGVAVWFTWDGEQRCIAVDRYPKIEHNLQAIHHILEARRVELRHGGLTVVRQTFKGFAALAAPSISWWTTLGFQPGQTITRNDVLRAFRERAEECHPDKPGGSTEKMAELNRARDIALAQYPA